MLWLLEVNWALIGKSAGEVRGARGAKQVPHERVRQACVQRTHAWR
jgi:hypothetical protein